MGWFHERLSSLAILLSNPSQHSNRKEPRQVGNYDVDGLPPGRFMRKLPDLLHEQQMELSEFTLGEGFREAAPYCDVLMFYGVP